jgi:heme-degrading monooxygenase HmoA
MILFYWADGRLSCSPGWRCIMAVRVLIEREIELGREVELHQMLVKLRGKAMQARGYISGETLRSLDNPNKFLVISTWNSVEDWKSWDSHPDRKSCEVELNEILRYPEKATVYTYL